MNEYYADVIVDISHEKLDRSFQYRIPERFREKLKVGMRVWIPFGAGNKRIKGYVVGISETTKFDPAKIKELYEPVSEDAGVEDRSVEMAAWIREHYGSTMIQALKTVLPARQAVKKLEHKTVVCTAGREELADQLAKSLRAGHRAKIRLLQALLEQESIPYEWITGKLHVTAQTVGSLERAGLVRVESTYSYRNPVKEMRGEDKDLTLSETQRSIVEKVVQDLDQGLQKTYLLHGITGSGKTQVYIALAQEVVNRGKQVILLIPEIALTYQTLIRFYRHFGDRVSVINSTLSPGEKFDQCERAKRGEIDVIIGPRSALFTPFPNPGLIVMDEEHEGSYKSEGTPKYHARETAMHLAELTGAGLVLGSATPSMEAYYRAKKGEYEIFEMKERLTGGMLPKVEVVDLREELRAGNRSIFSRKLQALLADRLQKGQQSILFLNRRGYAGFLSCRSCGLILKCPHCDVSLSEHRGGRMLCHYCGYSAPKPTLCPQCGSNYILGFKAGTQQIEEKLKELFPGVRTLRMDGDTTKTKDSYEKILAAFADREADVLIGTQMIVKGHDFPGVTLVGVLAADLSLGSGDYRSGERTFQLLTQAVGRAGRGQEAGEAIVQTYQPEHYAVVHAANQDYESFYEEEILYRELGGYPPAEHMLAVQVFAASAENGERLSKRIAELAGGLQTNDSCRILGPSPATISKISDVYRFVLYIKSPSYEELIRVKDFLEKNISEMQLRHENIQFDFDPMNVL